MRLGNDKAAAITAELENYLETARSVLWVAADTVDHMVANGATNEEIVEYITRESAIHEHPSLMRVIRVSTDISTAIMLTVSAGLRRTITTRHKRLV